MLINIKKKIIHIISTVGRHILFINICFSSIFAHTEDESSMGYQSSDGEIKGIESQSMVKYFCVA